MVRKRRPTLPSVFVAPLGPSTLGRWSQCWPWQETGASSSSLTLDKARSPAGSMAMEGSVAEPMHRATIDCLASQPILSLSFARTHPHVLASASTDFSIRIWDVTLASPSIQSTPMSEGLPQPESPDSPPQGAITLAEKVKIDIRASMSPKKIPSLAALRANGLQTSRSEPNLGKPDRKGGRKLRDRDNRESSNSAVGEGAPKRKRKSKKHPEKEASKKTKPAWENEEGQVVAILAGVKGHTAAVLSIVSLPLDVRCATLIARTALAPCTPIAGILRRRPCCQDLAPPSAAPAATVSGAG